jgi:hypothetical protein
MPLSIPDELLLTIFELLPHLKPRAQAREVFAPLVFVCRQWNVSLPLHLHASSPNDPQTIALPLLYRDIPIRLNVKSNNIQALFESLSAAEHRGNSLWPYIRTASLIEEFQLETANKEHSAPIAELISLRDFLSHSTKMDTLRIWDTSGIAADAFTSTCTASTTLLHLQIYHLGPFILAPIGKIPRLRTLHIVARGAPKILPTLENAWTLADLEELLWDEIDTYEDSKEADTIRFLAACRFPRLRHAKLCVEVDDEDGPQLLNSFLRAQSALESLDVVMLPYSYEVALASSTLVCLSLQRCGNVDVALAEYVPPTLRRLDLPVFLGRNPMQHHSVAEVLQALFSCPKGICQVHLALGHRWGSNRASYETKFRLGGPPVLAGTMYADQLDAIRECAVQLETLGITVYDEDGKTLADYSQDSR